MTRSRTPQAIPPGGRTAASVHRARRIRWILVQIPFLLTLLCALWSWRWSAKRRKKQQ